MNTLVNLVLQGVSAKSLAINEASLRQNGKQEVDNRIASRQNIAYLLFPPNDGV